MQAVTAMARLETVLALSRTVVAIFAIVPLLVSGAAATDGTPVSVTTLVTLNLMYGISGIVGMVGARRCKTESRLRSLGMAMVAYDVAFFTFYAVISSGVRGAGNAAGLVALIAGPARFGIGGAVVTVAPVLATALLWPALDAGGQTLQPAATVFLVALVSATACAVTMMMRRAANAARTVTRQMHGAFENASIGMALLEPDGAVLRSNPALDAFFGEPVGWVYDAVTPEDRSKLRAALADLTEGRRPGVRLEARFLRPGGDEPWGLVAASLAPEAGRVVLQVEDISERKAYEAMLSDRASLDPLTRLPNRLVLLDRLERALSRGERCAVLFADLDGFKAVNDVLGHRAGDELLVEAARRFEQLVRPGDLVARFGGDEFVVLCTRIDREGATALARRIAVALRVDVGGVTVSASVGVAIHRPGVGASALVDEADAAMYRAKTAGGDRHALAADSMPGAAGRAAGDAARYRRMLALAQDVTARLDVDGVVESALAALAEVVPLSKSSIELVDERRPGVVTRLPAPREPVHGRLDVPLVADDRVVAMLRVDAARLDDDDRTAVLAFAPVVGVALGNARRFEREAASLTG